MDRMFRVGIIISMHGIKGAVNVYPTCDDPKRFEKLKQVYFCPKGTDEDSFPNEILKELTISRVQYFKDRVILTFDGIGRIEDAEGLKDGSLWIPDEKAIPLKANEFYSRDYMQASVVTDQGRILGREDQMLETKAGYILYVKDDKDHEILIPVIQDCIVLLDKAAKRIVVHLLKGMES